MWNTTKRGSGTAESTLGNQLLQELVEWKLAMAILVGWADSCDRFSAVSDKQSLAFTDGTQVASEAVFEFTAADPLHVATSLNIVATKARGGHHRVSLIPGRTPPGLVSRHG